MSLSEIILWAVVLVVGVPSAWRNPTAGALVLSWVVSEGVYAFTGNGLATEYFLYPDFFVLAVIMMKPEVCNYRPYRGAWHQLKCILIERSVPDRIVMCIFPLMWWLYAATIAPYYVYWGLYWLALAQFAAAGWESLSKFRRAYRAVSDAPDYPSSDSEFRFAWVRGGG